MSDTMKNRPTVVITVGINDKPRARLAEVADLIDVASYDADVLRKAVANADGIVVRVPLPQDIFEHGPRLRAVVRHGVGLDLIPMEEATKRRIPVANVPHGNARAVAEYCFAGLLEFSRNVGRIHRTFADGRDWNKARAISDEAIEIGSMSLGVVGFGNIGQRVAALGRGFGMPVKVALRTPKAVPEGIEITDIDGLFKTCDVIVLCCPSNAETKGLVSAARLAMAKPSLILVNPSRGAVVDGAALLSALTAKRIRGAILDVHEPTPLPKDSPYFALPNVLLTPHLAGITQESLDLTGRVTASEMIRMLNGERPEYLCNPELYRQ